MMERWRVSVAEFEQALRRHATDEALYAWFKDRVHPDDVRIANEWLETERVENLDRQSAEEMAPAERG